MLSRQLVRHRPHLGRAARYLRSPPGTRPVSTSTRASPSLWGLAPFAVGFPAGWYLYDYIAGPDRRKPKVVESLLEIPAELGLVPKGDGVPNLDKLGTTGQVKFTAGLSIDEVDEQLNRETSSHIVGGITGVSGYDIAQVPSNSPCEDAYMHGKISNPLGPASSKAGEWMVWAVFDGHCGWQLSDMLKTQLLPFVREALAEIQPASGSEGASDEAVARALKTAFTKFDDAIVKSALETIDGPEPFAEKVSKLEAAYAGSCALLTLYDPASGKLHIASTGDCRAVLGQQPAAGDAWEARALTVDQTGANEEEAARIKAQFPDEPEIVQGGRVWGMQPSRTFGDGMWKWGAELKKRLRQEYNGIRLPSSVRYKAYKEGPYLTAEPVVSTVTLDPKRRAVLVLATDGLWDAMSSEQAVSLAGRWREWRDTPDRAPEVRPRPETVYPPVQFGKTDCSYVEEHTVLRDANAAVHLIRNALGGAHEERLRGAMTVRSPNSRDIRDDITVQVVFFEPTSA